MIIKVLLVLGIAGAAALALRGRNSSTHLAVRRLLGALFVLIAAVSVIFPGAVTWIAIHLGVSTGSNLVLYALVVAFLFVTIGLNQRVHMLEQRTIHLSRQLALMTHQAEIDGNAATIESESAR